VQQHLAGGRAHQAHQGVAQGRLAHAVAAEDGRPPRRPC
jgi:hypothetical protein